MEAQHSATAGIGHNRAGVTVDVEVRLFNSLASYAPEGRPQHLTMPAGTSVGDMILQLGLPPDRVFLVLVNGRDVTASLHGPINTARVLEDGDVVAFSGPVPYSWGYGAPVV